MFFSIQVFVHVYLIDDNYTKHVSKPVVDRAYRNHIRKLVKLGLAKYELTS